MAESGNHEVVQRVRQLVRILFCNHVLCVDDGQRTKYRLFTLQTVFDDDHMVVRVSRNSCFITEAFDTTVTATVIY